MRGTEAPAPDSAVQPFPSGRDGLLALLCPRFAFAGRLGGSRLCGLAGVARRALPGRDERGRVQLHFSVHEPEVAVAPMQRRGMVGVIASDFIDHVFEHQIDVADLAVLVVPQLGAVGLNGAFDVIVQGRGDGDEMK